MRKFAIALAILAFGLVSILNLYAASLSSVILPDTARVGTTGAAIENETLAGLRKFKSLRLEEPRRSVCEVCHKPLGATVCAVRHIEMDPMLLILHAYGVATRR